MMWNWFKALWDARNDPKSECNMFTLEDEVVGPGHPYYDIFTDAVNTGGGIYETDETGKIVKVKGFDNER